MRSCIVVFDMVSQVCLTDACGLSTVVDRLPGIPVEGVLLSRGVAQLGSASALGYPSRRFHFPSAFEPETAFLFRLFMGFLQFASDLGVLGRRTIGHSECAEFGDLSHATSFV